MIIKSKKTNKKSFLRIQLIFCLSLFILLIHANIILCINSNTNDEFIEKTARSNDPDPLVNNYAPKIEADLRQINYKYPNDDPGWVIIKCNISDDDKPSGNGGRIFFDVRAVCDALYISDLLTYDESSSENASEYPNEFNLTTKEGHWFLNISIPTRKPAGNYIIKVTANDNGTSPGKKSSSVDIIIRLYQVNRPPQSKKYNVDFKYAHFFDEDTYLTTPYIFNVNDTLFYDQDVREGPFPNTKLDVLTFKFWNGEEWTQSFFDFGNFTLQFSNTNPNEVWIKCKENITTNVEEVIFNATDIEGEWVTEKITVSVNEVNDAPVLFKADKWYTNENVEVSKDGLTIKGKQDLRMHIIPYAYDCDDRLDYLNYFVAGCDLSKINIDQGTFNYIFQFYSDELNFILDNNWVGTFVVNLTVTDFHLDDWMNFTFEIENVNDEPILTKFNKNTIKNHKADIKEKAIEDNLFNVTISARDLDINIGINDNLTFSASSEHVELYNMEKFGSTKYNFSFLPFHSDVQRGYAIINVTVKDNHGPEIDDWALINISILKNNKAPVIAYIDGYLVNEHKLNMSTIEVNETVRFTIGAFDLNEDNLTCKTNISLNITNILFNKWIITFTPNNSQLGKILINITVNDGVLGSDGLEDWLELAWIVVPEVINYPPELIFDLDKTSLQISEVLSISGTITDDGIPLSGTLKVLIEIRDNYGNILLNETETHVSRDVFYYHFEIPSEFNNKSTIGEYLIIVWATDGKMNTSEQITNLTIKAKTESELEQDNLEKDTDNKGFLGMDPIMDMIIILIIVVILILISLIIVLKKKKEITKTYCQNCNRALPFGSMTCLYCNTPRQPVSVTCTYCGGLVPSSSLSCPTCGTFIQQLKVSSVAHSSEAISSTIPSPITSPSENVPSIPPTTETIYIEKQSVEGIQQTSSNFVQTYDHYQPVETITQQEHNQVKIENNKSIDDNDLSSKEKITLLEKRLVMGDISEEIYLNLKVKYESEGIPNERDSSYPPKTESIESIPFQTPLPEQQPTPISGLANCPQCESKIPFYTTPCPNCGLFLKW